MKNSMFTLIVILTGLVIWQQGRIGNLKERVKRAENALAECEAGPIVTGREISTETDTLRDKVKTDTPVAIREEVVLPAEKKKAAPEAATDSADSVPPLASAVAQSTHSGPCDCEELRINNFTRRFYDLSLKDDSLASISIRTSVYDNRLEPVELDYEGYRHTVREREVVTVTNTVEKQLRGRMFVGGFVQYRPDSTGRSTIGWGPGVAFIPKNDQFICGANYDVTNRAVMAFLYPKLRLFAGKR